MSVLPGFGGFARSLETIIDELVVEVVKDKLLTSAEELDGGRFQNLSVSETVFGGSPQGGELGFHHRRAHDVIAETLEGVVADLRDFREGLAQAEQMLETADTGTASDFDLRRAAVESLHEANRRFDGDERYDHARQGGSGGGEG
jgi:hypothetical protein